MIQNQGREEVGVFSKVVWVGEISPFLFLSILGGRGERAVQLQTEERWID